MEKTDKKIFSKVLKTTFTLDRSKRFFFFLSVSCVSGSRFFLFFLYFFYLQTMIDQFPNLQPQFADFLSREAVEFDQPGQPLHCWKTDSYSMILGGLTNPSRTDFNLQ